MRRSIGAVVEAELALVAEIGDASQVRGAKLFRFPIYGIPVETAEEIVERRAEIIAAPAPIADIEDPLELALDLRLIPERFGI